jgi:hypothetical protein
MGRLSVPCLDLGRQDLGGHPSTLGLVPSDLDLLDLDKDEGGARRISLPLEVRAVVCSVLSDQWFGGWLFGGEGGVGHVPEIAAAIVVATSLVLVVLTALKFLKWGTTSSEMTEEGRQRFVGLGFPLLALGIVGCLVAFVIMVARLTKGCDSPNRLRQERPGPL